MPDTVVYVQCTPSVLSAPRTKAIDTTKGIHSTVLSQNGSIFLIPCSDQYITNYVIRYPLEPLPNKFLWSNNRISFSNFGWEIDKNNNNKNSRRRESNKSFTMIYDFQQANLEYSIVIYLIKNIQIQSFDQFKEVKK